MAYVIADPGAGDGSDRNASSSPRRRSRPTPHRAGRPSAGAGRGGGPPVAQLAEARTSTCVPTPG